MDKKLLSKNFLFLMLGQALSMFGTNMIRFVISLYVLDVTGSAAIFGAFTAINYLPAIFLSPFGGVIADRGDKRKLMAVLDGCYCMIALLLGAAFQTQRSFMLAAGLRIVLAVVATFEAPVSSACIPLIVGKENLAKAHALAGQISSLAGLLTPLLSGLLYGIAGSGRVHYIAYLCAGFFLLAAAVELMLKIAVQEQKQYDSIVETLKYDLGDILKLAFREKTYIGETMLLNGLLTFLVSPYLSFGMTYLISGKLQLSAFWMGSAQAVAAAAAILGSTTAVFAAARFQTKHTYLFLIAMGACFFILTLALRDGISPEAAFAVIVLTNAAILFFANIAGIFIIPGMQKACPSNMIGRLMALFNVCNNVALPVGIWLQGILYEKYDDKLPAVFGVIALFTILMAVRGKNVYLRLQGGGKSGRD